MPDGTYAPCEPQDPADLTQEHAWYRTCASPGEIEAACALADVLAVMGDPVAQHWYRAAAYADHPRAQQALNQRAATWAAQLERAGMS